MMEEDEKKAIGETEKETPADETSTDETSADETSADETSADETLTDETSADETLTDETSADETLTDETSADETLTDETSADETSADETSADETLTDETSADETAEIIELTEDDIYDFADEDRLARIEEELLLEKSRNTKKNMLIVFVALLTLIVAGSLCFGVFTMINAQDKTYVMEFAGQKISAEELKMFYIFTDDDMDTAVSTLTDYLVYGHAAKENGITLNEEYRQDVLDAIESVKADITEAGFELPKLSDEKYFEYFSLQYMVDDIFEALSKDVEFSEEEFDIFLAENKDPIIIYYSTIDVKYIVTDSEETAEQARKALEDGAEEDEVIKEYSLAYDPELDSEIAPYPLSYLGIETELAMNIASLEEGEVSEVLNPSDGVYAVFIMCEKGLISDVEATDVARTSFENTASEEAAYAKIEEYEAAANIKLNEEAINSVRESVKAEAATSTDTNTPIESD